MKILIQKFGGTSVATHQRREMVCDKVIDAINRGFSPVVVVSAIGRKGDPYATDTLLSLINSKNDSNKREIDLLMCCGEIISAVVLSEIFIKKGYKVKVLTGGQAGIITDNNFGNAEVKTIKTSNILELLNKGIIPIVTGFQGMTENGDFTTLGRGGSDVTGAILGEALRAEAIEIFTDVDGIMTADPRIVPDAKIIEKINYNEVFQFADQGAKVIHPRAVEYAMRGNIPLYIKNTMSNAPGTIISSEVYNKKLITGITHLPNRTQVSIMFEDEEKDNDELFDLLAEYGISIDLINIFPNYKVFTIDSSDSDKIKYILDAKKYNYKIINNCSKIAAIGNGIRGVPGVMAKILKTLKDNNIKVLQTADSHTTIWCLVKEEDTIKAINALHKAFEL
ncbi:aspartate kinase [Caloramator sp. E03]|uniref:aspartate kinase n=1 Tax=Caloramator sp. E03 TaxID=2576307 RepID=UPI0011104A3E|nr:aspartate kinase [Caloramator sp. E03]QCX32290.1 aspartate kinase [Caloramator sp. E03]